MQEDYARQQREKEKERKLPQPQPKKEEVKKKTQIEAIAVNQRMLQAAKTLERMVNQNIFDEIAQGIYFYYPSIPFILFVYNKYILFKRHRLSLLE